MTRRAVYDEGALGIQTANRVGNQLRNLEAESAEHVQRRACGI